MIFSEKYLETSLAFSLLMLNFSLRAISNLMGYSLVSAGQASVPAKVNFVASLMNILGCLLLIPQFGFNGAVYSLIIMNVISQILYARYLAKNQIPVAVLQYLKPVFFYLILVGGYVMLGIQSYLVNLVISGAFLAFCWLKIEEFRMAAQFLLRNFLSTKIHKI